MINFLNRFLSRKQIIKNGDSVVFKNGIRGKVINYKSGNMGINIDGYLTLCEPLANYIGFTNIKDNRFNIISLNGINVI